MARPRTELHAILKSLDNAEEVYFQADETSTLKFPCIIYERFDSWVAYADDVKYLGKKRYNVIVVDRNPDSLLSDEVEDLPLTKFDRFYKASGLNHFVYKLYF